MTTTTAMADPADQNLDELKRRGRRRLIGAIVLALIAAVVVPMLLESEPRPLGEDVSVRIPPVDDDKLVAKLPGATPKGEPAKSAAVPSAAPPPAPSADPSPVPSAPESPPRKSLADAEKSVMNPASRDAKSTAKAPEPAKSTAPAPAKAPVEGKSEAPAKTEPPREGYVVQLAAFSDDKGANALVNKLKRAGYPAYTETVTTSRGTLWRVRVGGYPSRDAASQSRDRLKGEGHAGIVVPAK